MVGTAYRLRIMGSLALSLCHLAAGRVDAVCSLKPARSVDIAAGQLLVRECGLAIDLFEDPPFESAPLDLVGRSRVVAAGTPSCAGHWRPRSPPRLLGLELRQLAARSVLPRALPATAVARATTPATSTRWR